jgi:hypothetical protein
MLQTTALEARLLRELVEAGAVSHAVVKAVPGGFVLAVTIGLDCRLLEAQRGGARRFRTLDAVARFLHALGLVKFAVELENFGTGPTLV